MTEQSTPCATLFSMMKRRGGISYKDLAAMILSSKPLSDGRSPASRVNDRTWVSRFVVHAPVGSLQERYFCDFTTSALRVVSRLKSRQGRTLSSQDILNLVCGPDGTPMIEALQSLHQDTSLYRNVLQRISRESGFTADERAEIAMVLLVTAGCTADVRRAVGAAMDFARAMHGAAMATPLVTPSTASAQEAPAPESVPTTTLGLFRVVDGYVSGVPYWLPRTVEGVEVGALALDEGAINDVGVDASARHARIWCEDDGCWYVEGLGSRNGVKVVSGADHSEIAVEPPKVERPAGFVSQPVPLKPGDELLIGADTRFLVIEGVAAS